MTVFGVIFILLAFAAGAASVIFASTVYQQIYYILVALFWMILAFLVQAESNKRDVVKALWRIEDKVSQAEDDEEEAA